MILHLFNTRHCRSIFKILKTVPKFHTVKNGMRNCKDELIKYRTRYSNTPETRWKTSSCSLLVLCIGGSTTGLFLKTVKCDSIGRGVHTSVSAKESVKFDWGKFWIYLRPHFLEFVIAVFAALAVSFFNFKIPSLLGDIVNVMAKYANIFVKESNSSTFFKDVKSPVFSLCTTYIAQAGFTFLYILLLSRIGEKMASKIRQDLFKQIIFQDIEFFDKNRTGTLVNRLVADVQDFKSSFKQLVSQGIRSITQLIGGSVSLFIISPHMAGIALISVPIIVAFMSVLGRALRKLSNKTQVQSEYVTAICEEAIANIHTVRSNAAEYHEVEIFGNKTDEAALLAEQLGYGIAVFQALTNFFLNGLVLSTLFLGGHLMSKDTLSPGQIMAFLVASQNVQRSLSQGSVLLGTMIRGLSAGSRIFDNLSLSPNVDLLHGIVIPENELKGEIRFKNVSFSYPTRPEQMVLTNLNLVIKPGQTVALVGSSGSGKSTVAALLERFYEPNSGIITLDGYNLQLIQPHWLHSNVVGLIEQEPVLFATTILENIRFGNPSATKNEVFQVAQTSLSHEFIVSLPESYETNVGERGSQLSGGQKQRIAIARALLKKPIILIMDEATSALDAATETIVQKALDVAMQHKTTLIIAHRLSTIKNADLIVVLDKGKIVEAGKHTELLAKKGRYYELIKQQEKESVV